MGAKLSQDMAKQIRPVFEYMMSTLGLVIKIPSDEEIERINQILERRNELREQKKYAESDALRDELRRYECGDNRRGRTYHMDDKR